MTQCLLCSFLCIADLVPRYHSANVEFPDDSSRYPLHSSFEELEQGAERGCELCGLIMKMFKSVDGRDEYSWDWWWELLEEQSDGYIPVHSLVKRLPDSIHTKVRVYIGTSHMYGPRSDPVLDILKVHVGPHWKHDRKVPTLKLKLRTRYVWGDRAVRITSPVGRYYVGSLPVDPYTGSDRNFKLANEWLRNCKQRHRECLSPRVLSLPTRVINVGAKPGYEDVHLEVSEGSKAEYVALSHCWGGDIEVKLKEENLDDFQGRLPFEHLAANFKDAIKVTRKLGIRYLWIDSLCIIQDSTADWERESKTMTTVYRDCTLTVSALSSKKSDEGFLTYRTDDREVVDWESVRIGLLRHGDEVVQAMVGRFDPRHEEELWDLEDHEDSEKRGPLARRGWTLQENILSPRHLYYGANLVHWTCPTARRSANGMRGMYKYDKKYPAISSVLFNDILRRQIQVPAYDEEKVLSEYYTLVQRYSARNLTKGSDKFPAFSGIVQRLYPVFGDYLAGLWLRDIIRGLWWVKKDGGVPVREYRAPSWSWASVDGPVSYLEYMEGEGSLDAEMLDHTIHLADPDNPFGQVRWASPASPTSPTSLTLRGRTKRLMSPLHYRANPGEDMEDLFDVMIDEFRSLPDTVDRKNRIWSETRTAFLPGTDSREQNDNIAGKSHTSWIRLGSYFITPGKYVLLILRAIPDKEGGPLMRFWCLLLESVHGLRHEVFKRVGTLHGSVSEASLNKWPQRSIIII